MALTETQAQRIPSIDSFGSLPTLSTSGSSMFAKYIAKIFALQPAATAVECGVISAILLTAIVCLVLAVGDSVAGLVISDLGDAADKAR